MANKNDNKSMFLYTALIFIVAVLLIIFSFLGQTNMQKNQPQVSESPDKEMSISEKASILSEENTVLLENNSNLKKKIKNYPKKIYSLNLIMNHSYKNSHKMIYY